MTLGAALPRASQLVFYVKLTPDGILVRILDRSLDREAKRLGMKKPVCSERPPKNI